MKNKQQSWVRLGKNLTTLIIIVTIGLFFYVYKPVKNNTAYIKETDSLLVDDTTNSIAQISKIDTVINPNTASISDFIKIGLSEKQATHCVNYRNKGGHFFKKDDLKKIYNIDEKTFENIKNRIVIPIVNKQTKRKDVPQTTKVEKNEILIGINTCDTTELKQLPKIGSFRARKIIEQRNRLGGFYSIEQLYKIYSMDSTIIQAIKSHLHFDTTRINKININTATFKEINSHPLISYEQTKNICDYKKIVKHISNIEELRQNNILTNDEYEILKFYIKTID